jgi:ribonuclease-3
MHPVEERIHHKFRNSLLLAEALTHPSLSYESGKRGFDYQRLEFLGDAVLQLVITERLFVLFPSLSEGRLTKLRTRLVSREALQVHSRRLELGEHIMMGKGEESSGGRDRSSTLADVFEAIIGALYIDAGIEPAREFILRETGAMVEEVQSQPIELNPKGQLQELLQGISPLGPSYFVVAEEGPEHDKEFVSIVMWDGIELGRGRGRSKKVSEVSAAADALQQQRWK